jgi:hypothetical protein
MRKIIAATLVLSLCLQGSVPGAVRGKSAKYVGGTVSLYKERMDGKWDLEDDALVFTPKKKEAGALRIPYNKIDSLEYGQKVGRRVGGALAGAMIVSPVFLLLLFSKKRKHFLTIGFKDGEDKLQGAVFELAKGIVPESLQILETKSGKTVEFESDEAKKHAQKGD